MAFARTNPHLFTTTRAGKAEIDQEFTIQTGWINETYTFAQSIESQGIAGTTDPANVGKVPVTDGENIEWVKLTQDYIQPKSMNDGIFQDYGITKRTMGQNSVGTEQIEDVSVTLPKTKSEQRRAIVVSSTTSPSYRELLVGNEHVWQLPTLANIGDAQVSMQSLLAILNAQADTSLPGRKLTNIPLAALAAEVLQFLLPTGAILAFGGSTEPAGFLLCNGQTVSRVTYARLFAVIGENYGAGDGNTTFNVPDRRGRGSFGYVGGTAGRITQGSVDKLAIGGVGGEEKHTLTVDEMAAHEHSFQQYSGHEQLSNNAGTRDAVLYGNTQTQQTSAAGGGQPHNNMPPFQLDSCLIKT